MPDEKTNNWFLKHGLTPPSSTSHNIAPDDISKVLEKPELSNWRLEGNKLTVDTQFGPLVNYIDPSYILTGTDDSGFPILKKV